MFLQRAGLLQARQLRQVELTIKLGRTAGQFNCVDDVGPGWRHGARIIVTHPCAVKSRFTLKPCF